MSVGAGTDTLQIRTHRCQFHRLVSEIDTVVDEIELQTAPTILQQLTKDSNKYEYSECVAFSNLS